MKPVRVKDASHVIYDDSRWALLRKLRNKALSIITVLSREVANELKVIGSVARGDVRDESDIDIVIPYYIPTFRIEHTLLSSGFKIFSKEVTQATPSTAIKAHIFVDERTLITIPLTELSRKEREFYKFAGEVGYKELENSIRVPGVNKKLLAIIPTSRGHVEFSVINRELEVSHILGVSLDVIKERVRMLTRRDEMGRTGVYLRISVPLEENIEFFLRKRMLKDPVLRNRLRELLL
ncbi:MAG TPA: nucleotidyltransferase [Thermofilum sp.]|nr:nucleotidyltransferase [Thermofilum sp.]